MNTKYNIGDKVFVKNSYHFNSGIIRKICIIDGGILYYLSSNDQCPRIEEDLTQDIDAVYKDMQDRLMEECATTMDELKRDYYRLKSSLGEDK